MAFTTKVIHDTSPNFGDNPQTITESGQPESVTLQGLTPNTGHYVKAEIWEDGSLQNTSGIQGFTTIPAGTITLTHSQTTRSGYDYDVIYTYTSTYAPSWATLSTNSSTFQGAINSGNSTVSFHVTGLTAGEAYLTSVTMGDIYAETANVSGSIVTTVVNEITITDTDSGNTSVDVDLEYIVDGGFFVGYVEWWLGTQNPSTDVAQGHEYFNNGDETVTISGLTEGTEYKFRASITLNDHVTTVSSSVVTEQTLNIDYSTLYFTIENAANGSNTIALKAGSGDAAITVDVSTDNGTTWSQVTSTEGGATLATLGAREKLIMKHSGAFGYDSATGNTITATGNFKAYGNIASLANNTNFTTTGLTMPDYAFVDLFNGVDSKLVDASNIVFGSYSTAGMRCCARMFYGCSSISTTPSLSSITTIRSYCYVQMFMNCTSLRNVTSLPATTVLASSYNQMFTGCTSLRTPPALPATTLYNSCYLSMFSGCTSLTSAPNLPATTLLNDSYKNMFRNCTAITSAPRLDHVTSIGAGALKNMFYGCSLINEIYAPSVTTWDTANSENWLYGVAASGTLYKPANLTIPTNSPSGVPTGWNAETNYSLEYFTIENTSEYYNPVYMRSGASGVVTVETSTDGINWTSHTIGTSATAIGSLWNNGDKLMVRHTGAIYTNNTATSIETQHEFMVYGNIASLTHGSDFVGRKTMPSQAFRFLFRGCTTLKSAKNLVFDSFDSVSSYGCQSMFNNCTGLVDSPKLPATSLSDNCYASMFSGCTSLTTPPAIHATILSTECCQYMFSGCRSLTTPPSLSATTLPDSCYASMFSGCTSLTTAPNLPATTLADSCYASMFYGCTSLTTSPNLPATTLAQGCYRSMFYNCTSLTTAPSLSATILSSLCCESMFYGCTSLTTAPRLDHVTSVGTRSLQKMFWDCSLINEIYAPNITTWDTSNSNDWLVHVAASGTLHKPTDLTIPTNSTSGVPSGWTTQDY